MSARLEVLESEVLRLTLAERSHLLQRLIASLDTDPEVEAAWDREAAGLAVADRFLNEFRRVLEADPLAPPPRMAGALKKTQRTVIDAMQANVRRLA